MISEVRSPKSERIPKPEIGKGPAAVSGFGIPHSAFSRTSNFGLRISLQFVLAFAIVCGAFTLASAATFDELFLYGRRAYAAGGYQQASEIFQEALTLSPSSGVLHNFGNAEWQCGRVGPAVLAWEQAQWLDPYSANTRANLRFARKNMQIDAPEFSWYEVCSKWLPVNAWAWLAGVSLWIAIAMVMLPGIFRWRKADWHQALAAAGFAVFLLTLPAMFGVNSRSKLGVILNSHTPLRLTPTQEAQVLTKLPAGDLVRVERERPKYIYVRAGNAAAGWVERAQFGRICGE